LLIDKRFNRPSDAILTKPDHHMQHQTLDPRLLGRPVHLLPGFAAQLRDELVAAMRHPPGRRYWGGFQVDALAFGAPPAPGQARWLMFAGAPGLIGFAIERKVLLSVLNHRYGRPGVAPAPAQDPAAVRVTATEERLGVVLGQQLAALLAARVAAMPDQGPGASAPQLKARAGGAPAKGSWTIVVDVSELQSGARGQFWLALDQELMAAVLHGLMPQREQAAPMPRASRPLAAQLQLTVDGRLVSKDIPLAALFELRVGDVIPVSLGRAEVLLEESRLFTAAVTEHKGKLCLTSFEDAE
jgi:flagellar motor switch protein FliM